MEDKLMVEPFTTAIAADWERVIATTSPEPTILIITHPLLRRDPVRESTYDLLRALDSKYVRYMPYCTHPRLSIPALEAPSEEETSWDFSLIDADMVPILNATEGRDPIICFDAIPAWMLKTYKSIPYPDDPDEGTMEYMIEGQLQAAGNVDINRNKIVELRDPSGREFAEYSARIVSWYTQGGFTDENGKYHHSGHRFTISWWGVLNEPDLLYGMTPEQYTKIFDAVVEAVRRVSPEMKFAGPGLAAPGPPEFIEYFLDGRNHEHGIKVDMLAFHFYAVPMLGQDAASWEYTFFNRADSFLDTLKYINNIRKRLSPTTLINVDEIGIALPEHWEEWFAPSRGTASAIPAKYWNLCGAFFAYIYIGLSKQSTAVATAAWLVGYNESSSMMNGSTGQDTSWLTAIKLLKGELGNGARAVYTDVSRIAICPTDIAAQGFVTQKGRRLLLINKRNQDIDIDLSSVGSAILTKVVDGYCREPEIRVEKWNGGLLRLRPFAVAIVEIRDRLHR